MVDRMQDAGYNPRTILRTYVNLKAALERAVRREKLKVNPARDVELPPLLKAKKARVFTSEAEALQFIEVCRREQRDILFIFVLFTGLRPSEFIGLEYSKLSLAGVEVEGRWVERGLAVIDSQLTPVRGGGRRATTPKTEASVRKIYFPATIYYDLMERKDAHITRLRKLGQKHELVFTGDCGRPLRPGTLWRRLRSLCKLAGVGEEGRSLYTLRRSHATLSLLAGENLKSLSERMGHTSVEFTQDEYIDALPVMQQQAADKLEARLLRTNLADKTAGPAM
jgi:integrase